MLFAGSRGVLDPAARRWLRDRLFDSEPTAAEPSGVRSRYRDAARYAVRLLDALRSLRPHARLAALRRFHSAPCSHKLEMISRL